MANKNDKDAEAKARAEAEDELVRKRGMEQSAPFRAQINQPLKPPMSVADACALARERGEDEVVVNVPKAFILTFDHAEGMFAEYRNTRLHVPAGPQPMPRSLLDHWWVKANGVKPYVAPKVDISERRFTQADIDDARAKAKAEAEAAAVQRQGQQPPKQ